MPLWAQVLDDMRRRLALGEFTLGFPPERELVEQYDVSRHTMREAMRRLHNEGLIDRERGRGTFVREQPIEQRTGALYSLFKSIEDQGFEQRSVVLDLDSRRDPEIASQLELPANTWFVYLHRLRKAADTPIALDELWLPAIIAKPLLAADFEHTGVYKELDERCGVRPGAGWERLHPILPTKPERTLLGVKANEPAFLVERFTSHDDRPLEWRRSIVRGDLYSFVTNWADSGAATEPPSFAPTPR
jgi:GntR family transcriptional regulator